VKVFREAYCLDERFGIRVAAAFIILSGAELNYVYKLHFILIIPKFARRYRNTHTGFEINFLRWQRSTIQDAVKSVTRKKTFVSGGRTQSVGTINGKKCVLINE
jgi:hypothetical protein